MAIKHLFFTLTICFSILCSLSTSIADTNLTPKKETESAAAKTPAPKNEIQWQPYDTGIKLIKEQNKKGFLHFYTDWCTYCKVMNKNTFKDLKVIDYLNDNFVSIRVNADKHKKVAKKYGVSRFPNTWFISEDTTSLSSQPGYIQPDMLLNMLKFLNTDSFKEMKFSEFIASQKESQNPKKTITQ